MGKALAPPLGELRRMATGKATGRRVSGRPAFGTLCLQRMGMGGRTLTHVIGCPTTTTPQTRVNKQPL